MDDFFKRNKDFLIHLYFCGEIFGEFTLEQLYQEFKHRLIEELKQPISDEANNG